MFLKQQNKLKNFKTTESGMTLVEVMIVSLLIVVLVVIGLVYLRSQVYKGTDARRKAELRRIGIAAEEYEKDHDCYPLPNQVVCSPGTGLRPYLDKVPCDPLTDSTYYYDHEDSACPKWYRLYTSLSNESDADYIADLGPGGYFNYVYSSPNAPAAVTGETGSPPSGFYGCFAGVCTPINWDSSRPGPECDPNFQNSTCYDACTDSGGLPINSCAPWN